MGFYKLKDHGFLFKLIDNKGKFGFYGNNGRSRGNSRNYSRNSSNHYNNRSSYNQNNRNSNNFNRGSNDYNRNNGGTSNCFNRWLKRWLNNNGGFNPQNFFRDYQPGANNFYNNSSQGPRNNSIRGSVKNKRCRVSTDFPLGRRLKHFGKI